MELKISSKLKNKEKLVKKLKAKFGEGTVADEEDDENENEEEEEE